MTPMMVNGRPAGYAGPMMTGAAALPPMPRQAASAEHRGRPASQPAPQPQRRTAAPAPSADFRDDEWDLPAFLRRRAHHHEG